MANRESAAAALDAETPTRHAPPKKKPAERFTFIPNQLFDLVLPHNDPACARLLLWAFGKRAEHIRRGGDPQAFVLAVVYAEAAKGAGICRRSVPNGLKRAEAKGYLRCAQEAEPHRPGQPSRPARYVLNFAAPDVPYTTDPAVFVGFHSGPGCFTMTPEEFLTKRLPALGWAELLIEAATIRATWGHSDGNGGRRVNTPISLSDYQRATGLSREEAVRARRARIDAGGINEHRKGTFRCPGVYSFRRSEPVSDDPQSMQQADQEARNSPTRKHATSRPHGKPGEIRLLKTVLKR